MTKVFSTPAGRMLFKFAIVHNATTGYAVQILHCPATRDFGRDAHYSKTGLHYERDQRVIDNRGHCPNSPQEAAELASRWAAKYCRFLILDETV